MSYDLIVIGTGPGGYVAAIRAAQLGMKVAVVEKRATHGGTCLNVGCIPSKALLHASERYAEAADGAGHGLAAMGIKVKPELDLAAMLAFKDEGVKGNVQGIDYLLKKNKIDHFHGTGRIAAPGKVEVIFINGEKQTLEAKSIVIATGSEVASLPGMAIDEETIVSSTGALSLPKVPRRMVVIGGGYIGLELGSVWKRLGSEVTVVEMLPRIAPGLDGEVAKSFQRILEKQGIAFKLGMKVLGIEVKDGVCKLTIEPAAGGDKETLECDVVLVSVGRVPNTQGLGLADVGVKTDNRGRVVVDRRYETNVPGIYAIGDVIAGPMLAHKAEDEGVAVAEILAGQAGHVNYDVIPSVIYTAPEVASVGKTEEELKEAGIAYKAGKFPFTANGRAKVNRTSEGFVKILADAATDRVLGVHILGPDAGTMIAEAAVLMEFGGSAEDLARTCHAHPTLNEAVKEAALSVDGRPIHI
jgi:dihydrolipoamide dehydrogenase